MAKGEGQVIGEGVAGPVPFVENGPGLFSSVAAANMLFGDGSWPPHRRRNGQGVHERRPAGQPAAGGDGVVLEDRYGSRFKAHLSKTRYASTLGENHPFLIK